MKILISLFASVILMSAGQFAYATVACCYSGGECAEAITNQQCRNTGGTPASQATCDPNPCGTLPLDSVSANEVSIKDLGVEEPTLLPTNPLYFLKEAGRSFRRFFTFNPVAKAELELRIANQKAAETKKVQELMPDNAEALSKALENYQEAQERLKARLEALRETSENPNVDKLLEQLTDRSVKHLKVIDEVGEKLKDNKEVKALVEETKEKISETVAKGAEKDNPERFSLKLEKALVETSGGNLKHMRSVEIIDAFQNTASEEVKDELEKLRGDFSARLTEDLEELLKKEGKEGEVRIQTALEELPGDRMRRAVILEEIRQKADQRVAEVISKAGEAVERVTREEKNTASKAEEQIHRAEEMVIKIESRFAETKGIPKIVRNLATEAQERLKEARAAFEERKYGEAFGQARSAEILARNVLRLLEEERAETKAVLPASAAVSAEVREMCENIQERQVELKKMLAEGQISESDYRDKALVLQKEYDFCLRRSSSVPAAESVKARIVMPAVSTAPVSRCELLKQTLLDLDEMLKAGKIDNETYKLKYESIRKELEVCQESAKPVPVPVTMPVEKPTVPTRVESAPSAPAVLVAPATSAFYEFKIEADDNGFSMPLVNVPKGSKVKLHFIVKTTNVYYGGLRFTSPKFKTGSVKSGESATVEFIADESFSFQSWWPLQDVLKSTGKVNVQ